LADSIAATKYSKRSATEGSQVKPLTGATPLRKVCDERGLNQVRLSKFLKQFDDPDRLFIFGDRLASITGNRIFHLSR
jgi:hypothetical protein